MTSLRNNLKQLREAEDGQTLVEYALIVMFVAIALVVSLETLSGGVNGLIQSVTNQPALGGSGS